MADINLDEMLSDAKNAGRLEAKAEFDKQVAEVKSAQDREAEIEKAKADAKAEARKEFEAETKTNKRGGYSYHKNSSGSDDNEGMEEFNHWLKTGQETQNIKAALVEGTAGLGGVTVPNAFWNRISEKVREDSVMRKLGPTVIQTSHYKLDIPRIATGTSAAFTAEGNSFNESEPVMDSLTIQVYKMTQLMKVHNELLTDSQANLEEVLANQFAQSFADLENIWFFAGNGTNQANGALARSGLGETAASTGTITAAELNDLIYSLDEKYASRGKLVTKRSTIGLFTSLQGNPFLFNQTPAGSGVSLFGQPTYACSAIEALTTAKKAVLYGDFSQYYIVENGGLVVTRNPYLYMANGQVGIFAERRLGGDAVQVEAFKHLLMA
jgi:HK97 family phage major capsid protein